MAMIVRNLNKAKKTSVRSFSHRHARILWKNDWDPTEPTATRPLAFTDHADETPATYFYTHDLTKNVCEVLLRNGSAVSVVTEYDYTPFGAVTASNSATSNTFMFSSEVLDPETGLVYYNYRHYNPTDGRWISRDPIEEQGGVNGYVFVTNKLFNLSDILGAIGFGNIMWIINSAIPKQVSLFSLSITLGVWPVPVMPIVTIEAYMQIDVSVAECCKQNGDIGLYASGDFGFEMSGGVGTSIGGTSGVRAHRENTRNKKKTTRYRKTKGTENAGQYTKKPRFGDFYPSAPGNITTSFERPPCPKSFSMKTVMTVGISGFVSAGAGWFSVGAQFDTKFGVCEIPGACQFVNPIKNSDASVISGLGTGARIAVYGTAGVSLEIPLI